MSGIWLKACWRRGRECAGWWPESSDPRVVEGFRTHYPHLPEIASKAALLEDQSAQIMVCAAVPGDRAALAAVADAAWQGRADGQARRYGGGTIWPMLERTVRETGRIFSICFSERFLVPSVTVALRLIREGAIGRVVQTAGFGPHRLNRAIRPAWFFDPARYGGILGGHRFPSDRSVPDADWLRRRAHRCQHDWAVRRSEAGRVREFWRGGAAQRIVRPVISVSIGSLRTACRLGAMGG